MARLVIRSEHEVVFGMSAMLALGFVAGILTTLIVQGCTQ
jgi:hypothetical protein